VPHGIETSGLIKTFGTTRALDGVDPDEDFTGSENLVLVGRLLGLPWRGARQRASELLEASSAELVAKRLDLR
jgi:hypothetical protein